MQRFGAMCGRYFFDPEDYAGFLRQSGLAGRFKGGEIVPTAEAPVLADRSRVLLGRWGLPFFGGRELLHARAETVTSKKTFKPVFEHDRLMIPSSGFFEWQHINGKSQSGQKYFFRRKDEPRLYMAGLLLPSPEGPCFVIITREAGPSMRETHDREPLLLNRSEVLPWLSDPSAALKILQKGPALLSRTYCGS